MIGASVIRADGVVYSGNAEFIWSVGAAIANFRVWEIEILQKA